MEERQFNELAEAALRRIEEAIDAREDIDLEIKPGGVLELEFENGSKIIINRHTAAREIWLAARSGGYHFRFVDGDGWRSTRDDRNLMTVLEECIAAQLG